MRDTLVILHISDALDDREWWDAIGLPDPARWNLGEVNGVEQEWPADPGVFVRVAMEAALA